MIFAENNHLYYRNDMEQVLIEPYGENSFRIRATRGNTFRDDSFFEPLCAPECTFLDTGSYKSIINGRLECRINSRGILSFLRDGKLLLREYDRERYELANHPTSCALEISPRVYAPIIGSDNYHITVRFESNDGEKLYGMGQYQQNQLDLKGCLLELAHRNSQISVPFLLSSLGYGFLWNNPAIGKVFFGYNVTEWEAYSCKQIDYWITCGDTPADIIESYTAATGRVPEAPDDMLGFWQSKLRYRTQEELLNVAREYARRGIPLSVIIADYFHWPHQGDWDFDKEYWPDPEGMVTELQKMKIRLMVSVWPTVEKSSVNYDHLRESGCLVRNEFGNRMTQQGHACFLDMTNPEATAFMWQQIKEHYADCGIRNYWLDVAEPEYTGYEFRNYRYSAGTDLEVGNLYPRYYAKMIWDGQRKCGQNDIMNLIRCAWIGSQKYGVVAWSGDIGSSFEALRNQLAAGLNAGIAGLAWWTTDIGGFHGANVKDPAFTELLIRWFQFGTFCPIFRIHGYRDPHIEPISNHGGGLMDSGADNEIWSFGSFAYDIFVRLILFREQMKPYIKKTMKQAHETGKPVIRPMFMNYPNDSECWQISDQYFFGDDMMVCPVMEEGVTHRIVYFPEGTIWRDISTDELIQGGCRHDVDAPLEKIPVFVRQNELRDLKYCISQNMEHLYAMERDKQNDQSCCVTGQIERGFRRS